MNKIEPVTLRVIVVISPYRDATEVEMLNLRGYCAKLTLQGYFPIAAHLYFTQFLTETDLHRTAAREATRGLLAWFSHEKGVLEAHVMGSRMTKGMRKDIEMLTALGAKVLFVNGAKEESDADST